MSIKLVGAAYGDPGEPTTLSGAPFHLLAALERRYGAFPRVDFSLPKWQRRLVGAASFRPSSDDWARRFHLSPLAHKLRSRILRRELGRIGEPFDLVLQVHGWVEPPGHPYAVYIDTTWALASTHWPTVLSPDRPGQRWWARAERRLYHGAEHLFAMGTPAARSVVASYGVPSERVTVVGGGSNFDVVAPGPGRTALPVILFIGRDWERKGGPSLVSAFALVKRQVPTARLRIVGCTPAVDGDGIEVLGDVADRRVLSGLISRAAVFCLPSAYEPYGFALLEAMAHGVACVGTRVGAIPEIVEDGVTGLLVAPGDPADLARALVRVLHDAGLGHDLGAAGRLRVERELNWDRVVDRMAPTLSRICARGDQRRRA